MAPSDEQTFLDQPPSGAVEKAVRDSGGTERGTVMKAIYLNEQGEPEGEWHSQQMPEDSFASAKIDGLQQPPLSMEQLVYLAECHPVHSSALEQKVADIVGEGWDWKPIDEDNADEEARDELAAWFENLAPDDESAQEIVASAWDDAETTGWGHVEVARDPQGIVRRIYHVPGHTVRAHRDGYRLVQIRNGKKIWFARWGAEKDGKPVECDSRTGSMTTVRDKANELFVLKKKSRRSTWYGIPGYVSAIGWITLALAARDDNLLFFQNRREPRWVIILSNLEAGTDVEEDLRRAFVVDMKQPHRNIIVPITGNGKVDFQKLSNDQKDGAFETLSERADKAIMIGHRVPAERLANAQTGPLGGNATFAASRIYKDAVVAPTQSMLNQRLNRFIAAEWPKTSTAKSRAKLAIKEAGGQPARDQAGEPPTWRLEMKDLDLTDEAAEHSVIVSDFKADLYTLGEARAKLGYGPLMEKPMIDDPEADPADGTPKKIIDIEGEEFESPLNYLLYSQLPGTSQYDDPAPAPADVPAPPPVEEDPAFKDMRAAVTGLLADARSNKSAVEELRLQQEEQREREQRDGKS